MQGAGNDFIVLNCTVEAFALTAAQLKRLADRRYGVGCDQFLIVEPAQQPGADFTYRIFNADGGEVESCGNGARAFVRFVHEKNLTEKSTVVVDTAGGRITLAARADGRIVVDMGVPTQSAPKVPFVPQSPEMNDAITHTLALRMGMREISVVNVGNPHAVQIVVDVETAAVASEGAEIEHHAQFPARVNAGFVQIVSPHEIKLRVWERGVGETLACGTGACAAAVAGISRGVLRSPVVVHARGGDLEIEWAGSGNAVRLIGPAETVFEGVVEIDA